MTSEPYFKGVCVGGPYDGKFLASYDSRRILWKSRPLPPVGSVAGDEVSETEVYADRFVYDYDTLSGVGYWRLSELKYDDVFRMLFQNYRPAVTE